MNERSDRAANNVGHASPVSGETRWHVRVILGERRDVPRPQAGRLREGIQERHSEVANEGDESERERGETTRRAPAR